MDNTKYAPMIRALSRHGDRIALIDDRGQYAFSDLLLRSKKVAHQLLSERPDLEEARVAFLVPPGVDYVSTLLGIWLAGGIAVPLGLQYPAGELDYFLGDAAPECVVADGPLKERIRDLAQSRDIQFFSRNQGAPVVPTTLPPVDSDRRAMILYTSGSTNRPKGVVATHQNIAAQIKCLVEAWEWTAEDHALHVLPLHHVHGIINVLACALWVGAKCEMLPKFEPDRVCESIISGEITTFMAVPTIYVKLIAAWNNWPPRQRKRFSEACSRMRLMVSGSAALPVSVAEQWEAISGHTLLERYGMTEIGMALSNPLRGRRKLGTVGFPLPGIDVRLTDEQGNVISDDGQPGEIWVRGKTVFKEYWRQVETTREAFKGKWFRTGDVAVVEKGYYRILGRSSVDIIKTGGYKVSALETEEVLLRHPRIKECAVIGVEDEEWGERVSSVVVLEEGCSLDLCELRSWAKDKLVSYKIPKQLLLVEKLPRNSLGKVKKPELKTLFGMEA
ncbi:MAG: acyl-CoA synthetase [bacterium]